MRQRLTRLFTCSIHNRRSWRAWLVDDEYVFLLECFLEPLFQCRQEPPCFLLVGRNDAIDDNLIPIGNPRHGPEAGVRLWKEGEATKLIQQLLLQDLELLRFH
jgi:hypothetical protein